MQDICIHCGKEQYAPAVWDISMGISHCVWCGKMSYQMDVKEYSRLINKLKQQHEQ